MERSPVLRSLIGVGTYIGLQLVAEPTRPVQLMSLPDASREASRLTEYPIEFPIDRIQLTYVLMYGLEYAVARYEWGQHRVWPHDLVSWGREGGSPPLDNGVRYAIKGFDVRILIGANECLGDVLEDLDHAIGCGCDSCANRMRVYADRRRDQPVVKGD